MRLIAWNIRGGGGPRWWPIADAIAAQAPDIVVLGEYRPAASADLIAALMREGLRSVAETSPPRRFGGVALLSRVGFERLAVGEEIPPWRYLPIATGGVEVHAVYGPLKLEPYDTFWHAV